MANRKKDLNQITNKDLWNDFFEAITDIEKRLIRTFKELCICPEKVISEYIAGDREKYFPVFKYLLLSVFLSYLSYSFFYQPGEIGGPFYSSLSEAIKSAVPSTSAEKNVEIIFVKENFDIFYIEFHRLVVFCYKFLSGLSISAIFLACLLFFKKLNYNFASLMVLSVFVAGHGSILSTFAFVPLALVFDDLIFLSYLLYVPLFLYVFFCFVRISNAKVRRPYILSLSTCLAFVFIFLALNVCFGMGMMSYIRSYTPDFIKAAMVMSCCGFLAAP